MGRKILLLSGTTLFALTLAFVGCGKKEEPAPPPPPPPAAPAPEAAAPAGGEMKAGDQAAPAEAGKAPETEKKEEGKTK